MPRIRANGKKRIALISRESDEKTLDIAMLEAELLERGINVKVHSKLLTKDRSLRNAAGYIGEMLKQEASILGSDVVVLDTYCIPASMLPHAGGTKVVQIWHALAAVKKFGWQTVGKEGGTSGRFAKLMRMHRGYDYVVSPSDITSFHYCDAFNVPMSRIAKCGLPRIDYIKDVTSGEGREEVRKVIFDKYTELAPDNDSSDAEGKKTILYAPTFRKGKSVDVKGLLDAIDTDKYNLVVKLHPLYRGGDEEGLPHVIYDEVFSSYDWLAAADVIISDYSSLVVESSLADIPLYIYAYDLEEYDKSVGLNVDFEKEPIAPYVFADAKELSLALDKPYDMDALHAFRDRYIDVNTENCTQQLADFIESLI